MVQAWFMDDDTDSDQRLPHKRAENPDVSLAELRKLGVLYWKLNIDDIENNEELKQIRQDRGYSYEDCITCSPDKLPDYDNKLKMFFKEHLHSDEEIRFCTEGSGYFDVRNNDDKWIRILVTPGDLIVIPAGIYHRFTLDEKNFIVARRYFVGEPVWLPYNRPADDHEARINYLRTQQQPQAASA